MAPAILNLKTYDNGIFFDISKKHLSIRLFNPKNIYGHYCENHIDTFNTIYKPDKMLAKNIKAYKNTF